jgi:acyl dehydratase
VSGPGGAGLADLAGRRLGAKECRYEESDAILYALAVGAGATDLDLVYEERLRVLPTFALTLGLWAVEEAGALGAYDRMSTLHVGQTLQVHEPLPSTGAFDSTAEVRAVWDKGSAALLDVAVSSDYFDAVYTIFIPRAGGFGGEGSPPKPAAIPDRPPDAVTEVATWKDQAALYRLTGDRHPVHIDAAVAESAGFERPILHGLCSLGAVALASAGVTGRRPWELRGLSARFAAPVLPGSSIDVSCWTEPNQVRFVASVGETEVLKAGEASFTS